MIIGAKIVMISSKPRVCSFNRWAIFEPFSNLEKAVFVVFGRLSKTNVPKLRTLTLERAS